MKIKKIHAINRDYKALQTFVQRISWFNCVQSTEAMVITLEEWLDMNISPTDDYLEYLSIVNEIRQTGNKELKKNLPVVSPGALMNSRNKEIPIAERIITTTGWMQFDIDLKDNPGIFNPELLRDEVSRIVYVAYCSLSVSGKGVWGLIKVSEPNRYREHFQQLKIDFESRGIILDPSKGGNPTDLRFYSYDPGAYITDSFDVYDRLCMSYNRQYQKENFKTSTKQNWEKALELAKTVNLKRIDLAPDYETFRDVGFALSNEFGEEGRHLFHMVCSTSVKYNEKEADKQYSACLNSGGSGITIGTYYYLCKQHGLYQ